MSTAPKRWCKWDSCHEFEPGSHNAAYCVDCKCKRKLENSKKRLSEEAVSDVELWALQERRKAGNAVASQQKNEWLLANKRIVFFDIETFDLAADFGLVMVGCVKDRGGSTQTFVAHGDKDERECLLATRAALEDADYVCTYYGTRFDLPYLNTRLLLNDERPVDKIRHIDLYYTARFKLRLNRNRLQNLEEAFQLGTSKTRIVPGIWRRALQGDQEALDYIADHCRRDVIILEDAFNKLVGFINLSATRLRKYGGAY